MAGVVFQARSARDGRWSDPQTWEDHHVPSAGQFVQIRSGTVVTYDVDSDVPIRMIHVAGTLAFARDRSTRLDVGVIRIQGGDDATENGFDCDAHARQTPAVGGPAPALEIGTADDPIPPGVTARVRLVYFPGADPSTTPAIIDCGGRMDFHGAPMSRTWVKLGSTAEAGDNAVILGEPVSGWRPGDHVIITASKAPEYSGGARHDPDNSNLTGTEERSIVSISQTRVTLDRPLRKEHIATDAGRTEIANLSRNVIIESASPDGVRGHTMYHRGSSGSISYAEFRHLGKRGILGKYPIHFHLVGDSMRGTSVIGASIWDSQNRWMAIHGTDYLLIRDCVGYRSVGHGFFLEDGTEQYNILDRNLGCQALAGKRLPEQALPFDDNEGAAFWWANGCNTLVRNVACENDRYGFRFQIDKIHDRDPVLSVRQPDGSEKAVDVRSIPFLRFEQNESHSEGLYSFDFGDDPNGSVHGDRTHPFITRHLRAWNTHYALRPSLSYYLMDDLNVDGAVYGVYHPDYDQHVYRNIRINRVNSEPINRGHDDDSIQWGSFTYENLALENCRTGRDPIIQLTCTSPNPGQTGHFRNVTVKDCQSPANIVDLGGGPRNDKLQNPVIYYFHDWPAPGQTLKVVSVKFPQLMTEDGYQSIPRLTGPDVRAAEVPDVPFPNLLDPVDDLPPATIITRVRRDGDRLLIHGVSQDNGKVAQVKVNGQAARIVAQHAGVADWKIELSAAGVSEVEAAASDEAGNVEQMPAKVRVAQ